MRNCRLERARTGYPFSMAIISARVEKWVGWQAIVITSYSIHYTKLYDAHYLTNSTFPLKPGDSCLVHAAAGGVGLLLLQMAKRRGARTIGTVSTPAKERLAKQFGADEVIRYTEQDFEEEVKRRTDGRGVQVVYDSVGRDTFEKSLRCLALRGFLVLYGQSSGLV